MRDVQFVIANPRTGSIIQLAAGLNDVSKEKVFVDYITYVLRIHSNSVQTKQDWRMNLLLTSPNRATSSFVIIIQIGLTTEDQHGIRDIAGLWINLGGILSV